MPNNGEKDKTTDENKTVMKERRRSIVKERKKGSGRKLMTEWTN